MLEVIAAVAGYENQESRWFWGGSISRIPVFATQFSSGLIEVDGELAQAQQFIQFRQTQNRVGGYVAYPFSRVQRPEMSAGYTNYSFSREARPSPSLSTPGR